MGGGGRGGGEEGRGQVVGAATAAAGPGGRVSHGSKERKNRQAVAGGCSMKGDVVCVYSTGPKQPGRGPPAGGHQLAVCRLTGGAVGTHGAARQWTTNPPPLGRRDGQRAGSALRAAAPRGQAAASVPHLCCRSAAHPPESVLREQARPQSPSFRSRTSLPPTSSTACSLPRQNIRSPRGHRDDRKRAIR